ncbi:MAG: flagellar biosynthetic protein FliQ [Acidimicrobiales bacterium]|jgi:flagellar biosynthetic protein FliQ
MSDASAIHLATQAMVLVAKLALPILGTSLVVGVFFSLIQSMTQIQDYSFSFLPKLIAVALVLFFTGNWMLLQIQQFTEGLFNSIPHLVGGG